MRHQPGVAIRNPVDLNDRRNRRKEKESATPIPDGPQKR
jgi:hypothetical protein